LIDFFALMIFVIMALSQAVSLIFRSQKLNTCAKGEVDGL